MTQKPTPCNTQYAIRNTQYLWTLLLLALLASAKLWGPGIVNTRGGGDSPFLLQRLHQMTANLRAGVFPVRWMPDAAYGLGYPFFNHYSALPFYVAGLLNLLGLDPLTALKLTQTLGLAVAALATYGWVYHMWRRRDVAWLAAAAYTVAPFHLVNVYVRGDSLSEFYAFIFYPLILWALQRVVEAENRLYKEIGFLALAYAGLVLSHNISAFIFSPFVALYLLFLVWNRARGPAPGDTAWRTMVRPLGLGLTGLLLGAALSAWAWLPALLEQDAIQSGTLTLGYFNYANHFRTTNLVQPRLLFDYGIAVASGGPSPFAMDGPQALVALAGTLLLLRRATRRRPSDPATAFVILGLLLATAMITPLSRPLWDHVPLLEMVQFPWRFLSVQSLFAAVAAGGLVLPLKGRRAWGVAGAVALLLAVSTLLSLHPERLLIDLDDVTATRLQEYELFTGNIGTTIRHEWLPADAQPRPFIFDTVIAPHHPPQAIPLTGALDAVTQEEHRPTRQTWHVQAGQEGAAMALPLLYWPGWRATVDGQDSPVWAVEGSGYLALEVPEGQHTVHLTLDRTPLRAGAETLSLLVLVVLGILTLWQVRPALRFTQHLSRLVLYAVPFMLALLFLVAQSAPPPHRLDDLTMDFVAMPYLHHNPDGVPFEGQTRLLGYTLSADELDPGETLTVELQWDGDRPLPANSQVSLRLVSPAEHLPDLKSGPYGLDEATVPLAATTVHRLTVPDDIPRGVYLLQLRLWGPEGELTARTPAGEGRGALYLRPVRVTEGAPLPLDAPLLRVVGPDIRLHAARIEATRPADGANGSYLTLRLQWSTRRRLATNYGVSLRLLDPQGDLRIQRDTQPGYGFAPTSLWRPGERIGDRYNLPLPADLPPGDGYRLVLVFYRFPSTVEVGRVVLGPFALPLASPHTFEPPARRFDLPSLANPLDMDFGESIRLAGYELEKAPATLDLTLWWVARQQPPLDYTIFVHLFDPATGDIPTQHDGMPRQGSYPTSGWLAGEVVSDTVHLDLGPVPPGDYRLALGLYDVATADRLPVIAPDGTALPQQQLILPDEIAVSGP